MTPRVFTKERLGGIGISVARVEGPRLIGVDPAFGAEAGGDPININGANLTGIVSTVTIGGASATSIVHVSDRVITCVTPAGSGVDDVVVTISGKVLTLAGAFNYTASGGSELVLASDWSNSTGTGDTAISNGGQWAVSGGAAPSARFEVVATSGLGIDFPGTMTNVLRLRTRQEGPPFGRGIFLSDQFSTLAIGETRYWRLYYRNETVVDPGDGTHHPQMSEAAGFIWFWMQFRPDGTTTLKQHFDMRYDSAQNHDYRHLWQIQTMQHDKTYRCEWAINRLAAEFCHFDIRIYNSSDELEFDNTDLWDNLHGYYASSNPHDAEEAGANSRVDDRTPDGWDKTRDFLISLDGSEFGTDLPCYYGGFAVSNTDWCGPYVSGEGP